MKQIQQFIIFLLCITVIGIFANWAQNDYGIWIISACLFSISTLFFISAFLTLKENKLFQISFSLLLLIVPLPMLLSSIFEVSDQIDLVFGISVTGNLILSLILPLVMMMVRFVGKRAVPVREFVYAVYPAFFALAVGFKLNHFSGANVFLVLSAIMVPAQMSQIYSYWKDFRTAKTPYFLPKALLCLIVALVWLGTVFKLMHWPGAGLLLTSGFFVVILFVGILIYGIFKPGLFPELIRLSWPLKTLSSVFVVISIYSLLVMAQLAPAYYSTQYPPTLDELTAKSNNLTEQGRKNREQSDFFRDQYLNFVDRWGD